MNYIRHKGFRTDHKLMFCDNLLGGLRIWQSNGKRLILMMDANEYISNGEMCKQLRLGDIDMHPEVDSTTPGTSLKTWFRGKHAIDDIWFFSDLEVIAVSYLPFHGNIGDHRPVVVNATIQSILGTNIPRIIPPAARRLNSRVDRIRVPYVKKIKALFKDHNILERLQTIYAPTDDPATEDARTALEALDNQMEDFMLSAEKGCRKFGLANTNLVRPSRVFLIDVTP